MKNIFIFDVESTSLHGTGFAVGAIVSTPNGDVIDQFELLSLEGAQKASTWVKENVLPALSEIENCTTDLQLRNRFFNFYMKYKETCEIWGDCIFPVETNFLAAVVADSSETREWSMPYPLKDISTLVDINIDRTAKYETETGRKLKKHNPTDDCVASLYCLLWKS